MGARARGRAALTAKSQPWCAFTFPFCIVYLAFFCLGWISCFIWLICSSWDWWFHFDASLKGTTAVFSSIKSSAPFVFLRCQVFLEAVCFHFLFPVHFLRSQVLLGAICLIFFRPSPFLQFFWGCLLPFFWVKSKAQQHWLKNCPKNKPKPRTDPENQKNERRPSPQPGIWVPRDKRQNRAMSKSAGRQANPEWNARLGVHLYNQKGKPGEPPSKWEKKHCTIGSGQWQRMSSSASETDEKVAPQCGPQVVITNTNLVAYSNLHQDSSSRHRLKTKKPQQSIMVKRPIAEGATCTTWKQVKKYRTAIERSQA